VATACDADVDIKTPRTRIACLIAILATMLAPASAGSPKKPGLLVFAAASLTDVLAELSSAWKSSTGGTVRLSFAASSVLARQIEAGGEADVFISADPQWMDYLQSRNLIDGASRSDLAGNRLVLIAPADSDLAITISADFPLAAALRGGRLATGDPRTVPAGRYARDALIRLRVWNDVADRLVPADNVRSAMLFVARGEVPLGIVYATDAAMDPKVRIVDTFPAYTHAPIVYPAAATRGASRDAAVFIEFLTGDRARAIFRKFGFVEIAR
jgi:molybdate transport system substrate-binding protein